MIIDDLVAKIRSEDEALAIFSALGFCMSDWPFIKKMGSPTDFLASSVIKKFIEERAHVYTPVFGKNLREGFDSFYQSGGFLTSPLTVPKSRLFQFAQAPLVFYGRQGKELLTKLSVAIVGSRVASKEALVLTEKLAAALAKRNVNVVSGGAVGIDQAAHRGALDAQGTTTVIAGIPCNLRHPDKFGTLSKTYGDRVGIIYPFGPFTPQGAFMFVERNRYVASVAQAVIIIQGKPKSGTLHTASFAKKLGIPLYALPGTPLDPLSYVPHRLLASGDARVIVDFDQFAASLAKPHAPKRRPINQHPKIKPKEKPELPYLLRMISEHDNSLSFEELLRLTGQPFADLQRQLLNYELSGVLIKRGAQFVLTGN